MATTMMKIRSNVNQFESLRDMTQCMEVSLVCGPYTVKAHKVVLAACSPHFSQLLVEAPCSHPIIILRDANVSHVQSLVEYMYTGETLINRDELGEFLKTARSLQIKGLEEVPQGERTSNGPPAP